MIEIHVENSKAWHCCQCITDNHVFNNKHMHYLICLKKRKGYHLWLTIHHPDFPKQRVVSPLKKKTYSVLHLSKSSLAQWNISFLQCALLTNELVMKLCRIFMISYETCNTDWLEGYIVYCNKLNITFDYRVLIL